MQLTPTLRFHNTQRLHFLCVSLAELRGFFLSCHPVSFSFWGIGKRSPQVHKTHSCVCRSQFAGRRWQSRVLGSAGRLVGWFGQAVVCPHPAHCPVPACHRNFRRVSAATPSPITNFAHPSFSSSLTLCPLRSLPLVCFEHPIRSLA